MATGSYAKVYRSLWDGTLGQRPDTWALFVFLMAHADAQGVVDMTPAAISARSGIALDRVRAGLSELEQPDAESRTPDQDGVRIVRLDTHRSWGWRIVNYLKYRTSTPAERKAEQRHRESHEVTNGHGASRHVTTSHQAVSRSIGSKQKKKESTPLRSDDDFERAWSAFPHYQRRSRKAVALVRWRALKPRPHIEEVLQAIDLQASTDDWTKSNGQFVPGMQVWIAQRGWESSEASRAAPDPTTPPDPLAKARAILRQLEAEDAKHPQTR